VKGIEAVGFGDGWGFSKLFFILHRTSNPLKMANKAMNQTSKQDPGMDGPETATPGEFASRLAAARKLVESLERPGEDLDQAMQAYTQAMEELNWCRDYLAKARLKVEQLVAKN
jgi:exodeoxyribonuclease VII small subunit